MSAEIKRLVEEIRAHQAVDTSEFDYDQYRKHENISYCLGSDACDLLLSLADEGVI